VTSDHKSLSDEPEAPKGTALTQQLESNQPSDTEDTGGDTAENTAGDTPADITETDTAEESETDTEESEAGADDTEESEAGADDTEESEAGADDTEESEAGADDTESSAAPRRKLSWALIAVLLALLLAAAGMTSWLYLHSYRSDQQTNQAVADRALDAAKAGTVAALSYSPPTLDQDLTAAKSHLTGKFLTYYTEFTDQVVRPAVKDKAVSTTANVVRGAVSELHPDKATVLLFVNQTTTSNDRPEPALMASSVLVTLDKVDGNWLISDFNPV
jgi:Mce-associated membrane protein